MTMTEQARDAKPAAIDKEQLRSKYREERNKRLRPDGNDQYLQIKGQLAHYLEDPYTPVMERAPKTDHVTFAFIGGGFAGLATAARLTEAGVKDVRIVEKGGDFGGTWYWNRYPGAQCDTASMVYMPLLEETGTCRRRNTRMRRRSSRIASGSARQFNLYDNALFHTEVTGLDWDDGAIALDHPHHARRRLHRAICRHRYRARCTCRSCPAFPASRTSRATRSTPAAGTTTTPAAIPAAR